MQYPRPPSRRASLARLRRSLRASTAEGVVAEVVGATSSGAVLTAWALHLGASPSQLGLLVALPSLAQVFHLPAAWVTAALGRRRVAIAAVAGARLVYLALAFMPLLRLGPPAGLALLFVVSCVSSALGVTGNNAWVSWMGELVPERVRGRYFGRRTGICTLGGTLAGLAAGRALDRAGGAGASLTLAALALTSAAAGVATTWLMARQQDVPAPSAGPLSPRLLVTPLLDPRTRGVFLYAAAWNAACGLANGFFVLHLIANLHVGFTLLAVHGAATAGVRMLAAPRWGRAVDRLGMRPVLVATSLTMAVVPLLWLLLRPDRLWPLVLDALLTGIFSSGQSLASFTLPMAMAPRRERPFFTASFALATGIPAAASAALAGAVAALLPARFVFAGTPVLALEVLFACSAVSRLGAVVLAASIVEPGARSLRQVSVLAGAKVGQAVRRVRPLIRRPGAAA